MTDKVTYGISTSLSSSVQPTLVKVKAVFFLLPTNAKLGQIM